MCFTALRKIGNDTTWTFAKTGFVVRIHRVFTDQQLEPGQELILAGKPAHYLGRVLRVAPGQTVVLFNGDGRDYVCEIRNARKNALALDVMSRLPAKPESPLHITVVQAVSRGERMDQTLQKCTELGVSTFQPVWSERVEVRLKGEKLARRQQHWKGVVVSSCEQSGRAVVPGVLETATLADWAMQTADGTRLVLAPGAERSLAGIQTSGPLELLIGPEGGFSDAELAMLKNADVIPVSLGPRILRTETAAPAAVAILQALGGDLGS
jgi:16S rRNA (uracil1498-N3)-methyltransferase